MFQNRIILFFYTGLTVLAFITPVKIPILYFIPGILLMWFLYLVYSISFERKVYLIYAGNSNSFVSSNPFYGIALASIYIIFYPLYIRFYTGSDAVLLISNFLLGQSNYYSYQTHFLETELYRFTLKKLPYIIGHGILRMLYIIYVFKSLVYKKRFLAIDLILIFIMSVTILMVGLARGTSFEFFEIFIIIIFALIARKSIQGKRKLFSNLGLILIIAISMLVLSFFMYNLSIRMGPNYSLVNNPDFDSESILFEISPALATAIFSLYGYFLFGIFFSSIIIFQLWFGSMLGFLSIFLPKGIELLNIDSDYRSFVSNYVDLGAKWNSDSMVLIESYGIIFTLVFVFLLGLTTKSIYKHRHFNVLALVLIFFMFYTMLSLPIGNFITASSANIISILGAIILFQFKKVNYILMKYL